MANKESFKAIVRGSCSCCPCCRDEDHPCECDTEVKYEEVFADRAAAVAACKAAVKEHKVDGDVVRIGPRGGEKKVDSFVWWLSDKE